MRPQYFQGPAQVALDGIQRHIQEFTNLGRIHIFLITQHNDGAGVCWQITDQRPQPIRQQRIPSLCLID
jgi:hypothetical protein